MNVEPSAPRVPTAPHGGVSTAPHGSVLLGPAGSQARSRHEQVCHEAMARQLASLLSMRFGGVHGTQADPAPAYFLPAEVLTVEQAAAAGIASERDLFGGVVPHAFVATKAITHPLVEPTAQAPRGWSHAFGRAVGALTLDGYTAFCPEDVLRAGERLLPAGSVRIKLPDANAGRDQYTVGNPSDLAELVARLDPARITACGVLVEQNLTDLVTWSIGQVRVGRLTLAYYGIQQLTPDNDGTLVYGGTRLHGRRGDLHELANRDDLPEPVRLAVRQAQAYDAAVTHCYPAMFASRRNYDVASGRDAHGRRRMGVLEQSWRVGGASSAELAAMLALQREPARQWVRASSLERYGADAKVPMAATVLFRGNDPCAGPIIKCAWVESAHADLGTPAEAIQ